jgi:Helix-turn-helix domain
LTTLDSCLMIALYIRLGEKSVFAKTPIEPNAVYTRQETAQLLGTSLSTLKQLIRSGQLQVSQPAGLRRVFIRGASILDMLDSSVRGRETTGNNGNGAKTIHLDWNSQVEGQALRAKQAKTGTRTVRRASRNAARAAGGTDR